MQKRLRGITVVSKVILIISLLVAISICDFFYILYIKRQLKFEKENSLKYLLYQRKYYESLVDKDKDIRRFYHDIRRHINILNVMANENHINEMKVYLTELGGEVEHFYLPHTQNLIVDYMLNNVISELQQFSNFSYQIRGKFSEKLHISNRDLSALIGNALENAKEALIKVEKEKRLELEIKSHNQFVFIMLSNTLNREEEKFPLKYKKDKENHGHGFTIMKRIVKKYNGNLEWQYKNGKFYLKIEL